MRPSMQNDVAREIAAIDLQPRWQRLVVGCGALFAGIAAGFFGAVLFAGGFRLAGGWQGSLLSSVGGGLVLVAYFMGLIWLRMWLGRREWLDRLILYLFWRSTIWLLVAVILLLVVASRIMLNR